MTTGELQIGIDWNDDRVICIGARPGDALNLISNPHHFKYMYVNTTGSSLLPKSYTHPSNYDYLGNYYVENLFTAANQRVILSSTSLVAGTYRVHVWFDCVNAHTYQVGAYDGSNAEVQMSADLPAQTGLQKGSVSFTLGATTTIRVGLKKISGGTDTAYVRAIMITSGSGNASQEWNSGKATDLYDYIKPISANWDVAGGKDTTTIANEGSMTVTVDNTDKRYSPGYVTSPLYGKFFEGHMMIARIQKSDGTWIRVWTGWTTTYSPDPYQFPGLATIEGVQGIFNLDRTIWKIGEILLKDTTYYLNNILPTILDRYWPAPGDRYGFILDRTPLDYGSFSQGITGYTDVYNIQTAYTPLINLDDNLVDKETTLRRFLQNVLEVERGFFFVDREGLPQYLNRYYGSGTVSPTTLNLDTNANVVSYEYGGEIINQAVVEYRPASTNISQELWRTRTPVQIKANSFVELEAKFVSTEGQPISINAISAIGSGSTATVVTETGVTAPTFWYEIRVTEFRGYAAVALINKSYQDLYFTVVLSGTRRDRSGGYSVTVSDDISIKENNIKEQSFSSAYFASEEDARSFGEYMVYEYGRRRHAVRNITSRWRDNTWLNNMLNNKVGSLLNVTASQLGLTDQSHMVIGERWSWRPEQIDQTLTLKSYKTYWIADQSAMSTPIAIGY